MIRIYKIDVVIKKGHDSLLKYLKFVTQQKGYVINFHN